jgi:hypothetical protein
MTEKVILTERIQVPVSRELREQLEKRRGLVPEAAYVRDLIERDLNE